MLELHPKLLLELLDFELLLVLELLENRMVLLLRLISVLLLELLKCNPGTNSTTPSTAYPKNTPVKEDSD